MNTLSFRTVNHIKSYPPTYQVFFSYLLNNLRYIFYLVPLHHLANVNLSYFLNTLSDLSYLPFSCTGVVHAFFTLHLYVFTRLQKVSLFILFFSNSTYTQSGYFLIFFIPFFLCSSKNLLSVFIIGVVAALSGDHPRLTLV